MVFKFSPVMQRKCGLAAHLLDFMHVADKEIEKTLKEKEKKTLHFYKFIN
jgi:hypothetical protein